MHIAIDMTYPNRIKTGTMVYVRELVSALSQHPGVRISYFAEPLVGSNLRGVAGKIGKGFHQLAWMQAVLPVKLATHRVDLLHEPAGFAPFITSCPYVVTLHDTIFRYFPQHYDRTWLAFTEVLLPRSLRGAAAIITDSQHAKQSIVQEYGVHPDKIHVVYLGVDSHRFHPARDRQQIHALRREMGLGGTLLLYVGTLSGRKNIPSLVESLALLSQQSPERDYQLALVGGESPGLKGYQDILDTIRRLGLAPKVHLLGHVTDSVLPDVYNMADVFVFPSLYEGFGLPLVEAMASGLPIVASDRSCIPEIVGGAALTVDPEKPAQIAAAVQQIMENSAVRSGLVQEGIKRSTLFTWQEAAERTAEVYSLAARGRRGNPAAMEYV